MTYPSSESPVYRVANPYVGPRTFEAADRQRYFGREAEAASLVGRVVSERLLLFYAQSGAGKSSLINARLIPALREEEGFSVLPVARVAGVLPVGAAQVDNIFLFNLMASLDRAATDPGPFAHLGLTEFLEHLVTEDGAAWRYDPTAAGSAEDAPPAPAKEGPVAAERASRFVLIVDQFEEIITGHPERWQEREEFFRQLDAALQANPNLWVVLSLREDYVAALDPYAPLAFNRLRARFYMERMGVDAALEAVRRPAELAGRPFAPGVAEQLVDNLRQVRVPGQQTPVPGQYVEPVQLQVVCYQLWENLVGAHPRGRPEGQVQAGQVQDLPLRGGAEITVVDLAAAGDVDRALTQFYEESLALALADPAAEDVSERHVRAWFDEELITETRTRGLVRQGEAETAGLPNAVVRALQRRFLVRGEARGGDTWIELVHDRFVEPIRESNAAWFAQHLSALQRQAALWIEQGRSPGLLLRDAALAEAETWAANHPTEVGEAERQFLDSCRQAQRSLERERRDSRRIRLLALAATVVALIAILTAFYAMAASRRAQTAKAETARLALGSRADQLTLFGLRSVDDDEPLAVLLAVEGLSVLRQGDSDPTMEGSSIANVNELFFKAGLATFSSHENIVANPTLSSDNHWLAIASSTGNAWLWDLTSSTREVPPVTLAGHKDSVNSVAFSPDNRWVATASSDNTARLWDVTDPAAPPRILDGHEAAIVSVAFSPDSRWLATASWDNTARLWNVMDPTASPVILDGHEAAIVSVAFSPDGRWLATASRDATARLWNVMDPTASPVILDGQTGDIVSVTFSPDGRWLATASRDNTVRLWDVADPAADPSILAGHKDAVVSVIFSPDARWLATVSRDKTARLWDLTDQAAAPRILADNEAGVNAVVFSPDTRWLAAALSDNTTRLWDIVDPEATPRILTGHADAVNVVAFSSNGRWLAAASKDHNVLLWDMTRIESRSDFVVLRGHKESVRSLVFGPDGRWLVTASDDGTVHRWFLSIEDMVTQACQIAGRNLTTVEWRRYFADQPYRKVCGQWPKHPSLTEAIRNQARTLAERGDIAAAAAKFEEALALDSELGIHPETEAKRIYAGTFVEQGNLLAQQGDLAGAMAKYKVALTVDHTLDIRPEVDSLVQRGMTLATTTDFTETIKVFDTISSVDTSYNVTETLSADRWNVICLYGRSARTAATVLPACDRAVALAPDDSEFRNSRGITRALSGDILGAIEDFQTYIELAQRQGQSDEAIAQRQAWIADLRAGKDFITIPDMQVRPPTVVLTAENIAHLRTFPRPPRNNGIGLHFHLDLSDQTINETVENLKSIRATWTLVYTEDVLQAQRAAMACWNEGIMPVTRIGALINGAPRDPVPFVQALHEIGVPAYVQIYNEPEDEREWANQQLPSNWAIVFGQNWARAATLVFDAGGYPGLQVLSKEAFDAVVDAVKEQGRTDIWKRVVFIQHNYAVNHPPSYPYDERNQRDYPGQTISQEEPSVLSFLRYAAWMQERLGFVLPIIGGEGGWLPDIDADVRYPKVETELHALYTKEMFEWMHTGILSNGEPLPDYLFSVTPWIAGSSTFGGQNWWGNFLLPDGKLTETIEAVQSIPPFVRKFSWDRQ